MNIQELRAGLAYVAALMHTIHDGAEGRALTEDETTSWNEGSQYLEATRAQIADHEAREKILAQADNGLGGPVDAARDFQYQRKTETQVDVRRAPLGEIRDAALALLERDSDDVDVTDDAKAQAERLIRRKDGEVAMRTVLTENDGYRSGFQKLLTGSMTFTPEEARALDEYREMNITTAADGGYGVPVFIDPTIMLTDQGSPNPFWSIASVETITSATWRGVSAAGMTWAFETESAPANDLSPTLAQPTIYAHKAQGFLPYTIEVGMDYPNFGGEMARLLGAGYDELALQKFTIGTGTGEPFGVFIAAAQATSQVTVNTDAQLHAADINTVWGALLPRFRSRASWLMNIDVNNEIQALGDDKLSKQTVNLAHGAVDILKGKPVYESPYAPAFTGTTGQASILVVGDFSNYKIVRRAGMSIEPIQHLFDTTTGAPIGQRALYAFARLGADIVVDNAFRMLVNT